MTVGMKCLNPACLERHRISTVSLRVGDGNECTCSDPDMIRIEHGDWQTLFPSVPDGSFDLVYTDPPYGMRYTTNIPKTKYTPIIGDSQEEHSEVDWEKLWSECYRVLSDDRFLIIHVNWSFLCTQKPLIEAAGFTVKGILCWQKQFAIGGDLKGSAKRDWEPILYVAKGKPRLNPIMVIRKGKRVTRERVSESSDWVFPLKTKEKLGHPTQKPVGLARQLIAWACPDGGAVLDPFCGSGTAMMGAKYQQRRGLGFEVDAEFVSISRRRLGLDMKE